MEIGEWRNRYGYAERRMDRKVGSKNDRGEKSETVCVLGVMQNGRGKQWIRVLSLVVPGERRERMEGRLREALLVFPQCGCKKKGVRRIG